MHRDAGRPNRRIARRPAGVGALLVAGLVAGAPSQVEAAPACSVSYQARSWTEGPGVGGFTAEVTITNTGDPLDGWTLAITLPEGQSLTQGWSASWDPGPPVTATNVSWNADLATGASTTVGFVGRWTGSYADPTGFTLDGTACRGVVDPDPDEPDPDEPDPDEPDPDEPDPDEPGAGKADNPFVGATGYVNADWQARVDAAAAATTDPTLAAQMRVVGRQSTAVWMDRIGAIEPTGDAMGLADHLDAAVQQDAANGPAPVAIQVVIYDLPNRDCAALASNGELRIAEGGLARYRTEYIDAIRTIMSDSAYADLRVVLIIEPDSLPNLVTNVSGAQASPDCIEAQQTGAYRDGIRYAVGELGALANTYLYLDIAHSGWLGWPNNFDAALGVFDQTLAAGQGGPGYDKIHGFITNTANYTPLDEVWLPNPYQQLANGQALSSTFYEWNPRFDEVDFATDLQRAFVARGCTGCGMLIDTSRNGWGGPDRPTAPSGSTVLETFVNESRVDRRPHRGGWCNQRGAGIGVRPTAATWVAGVDAYVWVKPPGESDGVAQPGIVDPDDPAKGFDAMCDPTAANRYAPAYPTNALPGAPHAGRWFPAQFEMLVRNAYPAL